MVNNFLKIILLVLLSTKLLALSNCEYKYEYKDASSSNVGKSVTDYVSMSSGGGDMWVVESTGVSIGTSLKCNRYDINCIVNIDNKCGEDEIELCEDWFTDEFYECGYDKWYEEEGSVFIDKYRVRYKCISASSCPTGYTADGSSCKKTVSYTYKNYTCNANDKNSQGFGWELVSNATNNGSKTDPDKTKDNSSTLDDTVYSHSSATNLCKRKYQQCTIDCEAPLTLDTSSGKCIMDYSTACENKGMFYNSTLNICEKANQCIYPEAEKDIDSDFCSIPPNCNVIDGVCGEEPNKTCNNNLGFSVERNRCEIGTDCTSSQIFLEDGTCGSLPYCDDGDVETLTNCINTAERSMSCGAYSRSGNLCYEQKGEDTFKLDYKRPLERVVITGSYKEKEYDTTVPVLCSANEENCKYRLTKIYTKNDGKDVCFVDNQGTEGCLHIEGSCTLDGSIQYDDGIRQLYIGNNNHTIYAYNKALTEDSIGVLQSSCTISGKVGSLTSPTNEGEIIAVKSDGIDMLFWDSYKRGAIGVISFLPTIPQTDINDGFTYKEQDIMKLINNNFTGFYSANSSTYAVYNGLISKADCENIIDGTSFFIAQAENEEEMKILDMLSFKGDLAYNFNDGDLENGSCVVKNTVITSMQEQYYSYKTIELEGALTEFVCSPFKCSNHSCQYNTCPDNFTGNLYDEPTMNDFLTNYYPEETVNGLCLDYKCDSTQPYFPFCGNGFGCKEDNDIFQQEDGSCVQVSCEDDEELDVTTNKCKKLDCPTNSYEKDGKCFQKLILE